MSLVVSGIVLGQVNVSQAKPTRAIHVPWTEDIPWSAVVEAAGENDQQPILIDFYAQWCGPCKLLDAFVYNESEVIAELADVLTFKVDVDKPEYFSLKEKFNITLLPTLIWCDSRGREIDRFTGSVSPKKFLEIIRAIRTGGNTFNHLSDMVAASPEDPGLLFDLARRNSERGNEDQARVLYRRLMNLRYKADKRVVVDGMLGLATLEESTGNHQRAVDITRRGSMVFSPGEPEARASLMAVASFQGTLEDTTGMLDTYRLLIDNDDTDWVALDAYARMATAAKQDMEQASRYAVRAVVMSDNNPRMMCTLAANYFERKQYHKAIRWMEKAVRKAPEVEHYAQLLDHYQETLKSKPYLFRGRRR